MIIHNISLPSKLNLFGKKPWEVPHLDTLELWKFGDYKHFTSLKLLTKVLQVPSPKDDIDGSEVEVIVSDYQFAGEHSIVWNSQNIPSGIYFIRLSSKDFIQTRKAILLK